MTYLKLDADRLLGIVDGLNRIAAAELDPDEVAEAVARVACVAAQADGASVEIDTPDLQKLIVSGHVEGAESRHSIALVHGIDLGTLSVTRAGTEPFAPEDIEAVRLVAQGAAPHIAHAIDYINVSYESRVDQLTGLGNRLAFEERLGWELSRASRYEEPISLVVFDIDNFGRLNDRFGPEECDQILVDVAGVLSQTRAADSAFRTGGDEFAVIMPNTTAEGAEIAAIRMGWVVANLRDDDAGLTISSGVAEADIPDPRIFFATAGSALRDAMAATQVRPAAVSA